MKLAVLFPGQGSQFLGMGKDFIEASPECREIMEKAEQICGTPLGQLCNEGPMEELTRAVNLQPAITAVNLICWKMLKKAIDDRAEISFTAGHSLGEYSALHAAGVLSVEDTISLVAKRGALMDREGNKNPGGMRAVIGLNIEQIEKIIAEYSGDGVITAANHNTEQQIVISGDETGLNAITEKAEAAGSKVVALNVSVANHSPLVADAVPDFKEFMSEIDFASPEIPVIFNVTAASENNGDVIKEIMAKQIASKVRWFETINSMLEDGVDTFIEVGPKTVLKGMMRKIVPRSISVTSLQFDSPAGLQKCLDKLFG